MFGITSTSEVEVYNNLKNMPRRFEPFENGNYYHIFNRGVAKLPVFISGSDYQQAILTMSYYLFADLKMKLSRFKSLSANERDKLIADLRFSDDKMVQIVSFVLMPNHFHFLLRQERDGGISKFVSLFTNSYTRYFNTKHSRVGPLFQGQFKAVNIEHENQLIHLSRYIHLNPYVSSIVSKDELLTYSWSSFPNYLGDESQTILTDPVMTYFKSSDEYKLFVLNHADYAESLEKMKHQTLDL